MPVTSSSRVFRPLPVQSGDIDSAGVSIASDQDIPDTQVIFLSSKAARSNDDSLTYSEDSDTTRIYNLNTRKTKIVVPAEEKAVESPIESPVKVAHQFFQSSPQKFTGIRKMDDEVTTVVRTSNHNLLNGGSVSLQVLNTKKKFSKKLLIVLFINSGSCCARSLRREASY